MASRALKGAAGGQGGRVAPSANPLTENEHHAMRVVDDDESVTFRCEGCGAVVRFEDELGTPDCPAVSIWPVMRL